MFKVLIAEDDGDLRQLFQHVLIQNGYFVKGVCNGKEGLEELEKENYDLIISDIMMPVMDGYTFIRTLREQGKNMPVLTITAKDAFHDMYMGFHSGTDDYMVKPININEMVLRVGALLRRYQMINERKQVMGGTIMEYDSFSVITNSERVVLPQKEFLLLYKLLSYPGKIFTRIQLMDEIWGADSETGWETVTVHVGRLRRRFEGWSEFEIESVRGLGYKAVKKV